MRRIDFSDKGVHVRIASAAAFIAAALALISIAFL
jgi:hypothetical protein